MKYNNFFLCSINFELSSYITSSDKSTNKFNNITYIDILISSFPLDKYMQNLLIFSNNFKNCLSDCTLFAVFSFKSATISLIMFMTLNFHNKICLSFIGTFVS